MKTIKTAFRSCFVIMIIFSMIAAATVLAEEKSGQDKKTDRLAKALTFTPDQYAILNINNLWAWQREDGLSNRSPEGEDGVFFPRNTTSLIYQDGIIWGAKAFVDVALTIPAPFGQTIRVGGANYGSGSRAGWIEGFGASAVPVDVDDPRARIYRIRRNWLELSEEAIKQDAGDCFEIPVSQVTEAQIQIIVDDYQWSWENWPVDLGAPFIDRNNNGLYDPAPPFKTDVPKDDPLYFGPTDLIDGGYDEPGLAGADPDLPADQVIWAVWNDLNRSLRFGSEPIGLEIQSTLWGYQREDALGDVIFRKIKLINKGGMEIAEDGSLGAFFLDSMYVGQWTDPDLGYSGDDLAGCDTVLNMGFVYNGDEMDSKYQDFGLQPPAAGYDILQGPVIPSLGDVAVFDLKTKQNHKNLGMTAFLHKGSGSPYTDPSNQNYENGALRWYKILRGFVPLPGPDMYYPTPPGGVPGPLPFAGDPIAGTGHIDGLGQEYSFRSGDRRFVCSSGPWQMALGDTQEVVLAIVCGLGAARLSSISVMKFNDTYAQKFYDSLLSLKTPKVSINTNYPTNTATEFQAQVNLSQFFDVTNAEINLTPQIGSELGINLVLYDDGLHNDSLAGDNIWGNSGLVVNRKYPFKGDLIVFTSSGTETLPVLSNLRLRPKPKLINWRVSWENGRQDKGINNNEKVHLKFDIFNQDGVTNINLIKIVNQTPGANFQTVRYDRVILPGNNEINDSLFLELEAPSSGDSMTFTYQIMYDSFSEESVLVNHPVINWEPGPVWVWPRCRNT